MIFTRLTKTLYNNLTKYYGSLIFRSTNEMLYTDKAAITRCFFVVLYGKFTMMTENECRNFGEDCGHGFTIGEEALFEPGLGKRYESCKATQPSACLRIDLEKFRNMSNVTMGGNVKYQRDYDMIESLLD